MPRLSAIPNLTGGSGVEVRKKVSTVYLTECPKCKTDLDVTSVTFGTHIECPNCKNVTYRPDYTPPWWIKIIDKGWKLILTATLTFGLGLLSSYFATSYYEKENKVTIGNETKQNITAEKDSTETNKKTENGN